MTRRVGAALEACVQGKPDFSSLAAPRRVGILGVAVTRAQHANVCP
jgi:hypothetical protein